MSYREKRIVASMISFALMLGAYAVIVAGMYQAGRFSGPDASRLVGLSILLLVAGGIVLHIIVTVLFTVLVAIRRRESDPSFVVDERDKHIELKGLRTSSSVTGAGFLLSIAALALGQSPLLVFHLIAAWFVLGGLVGDVVKFRTYRREG